MSDICIGGKKKEVIVLSSVYLILLTVFLLDINLGKPGWFLHQMMLLTLTLLTINILHRFLNYTNRYLKFISDASYAFYILHHPVVIIIGLLYLKLGRESFLMLDYLLLCAISISSTYIIYYYLVMNNNFGNYFITGYLDRSLLRYFAVVRNNYRKLRLATISVSRKNF